MDLHDIIKKARNAEPFSRAEVVAMLTLAPDSLEAYVMTGEASGNRSRSTPSWLCLSVEKTIGNGQAGGVFLSALAVLLRKGYYKEIHFQ